MFWLVLTLWLAEAGARHWEVQPAMPLARSDTAASVIGSHVFFITGGCTQDQVCKDGLCTCAEITNATQRFDASLGTWQEMAQMPRPRYRHVSLVFQGKMYVFGGRTLADEIVMEADMYDPGADAWESVEKWRLPIALSDQVGFVIGDEFFLAGGYTQDYNTSGLTFSLTVSVANSTWMHLPNNMTVSRGDACAVAAHGSGYVFGGFNDADFCTALSSVEIFHPATHTWVKGQNMPSARADSGCDMFEGQALVMGGERPRPDNCSLGDVLDTAESYAPLQNDWQDQMDIVDPRFRFSAAVTDPGAEPYTLCVFGGQSALDEGTNTYKVLRSVECLFVGDTPAPVPPPRPIAISAGTILTLTFFAGMFIYLGCGTVVNKARTGQERLPNLESWKAFFGLVRDGCLFTLSCFIGKSNAYDRV